MDYWFIQSAGISNHKLELATKRYYRLRGAQINGIVLHARKQMASTKIKLNTGSKRLKEEWNLFTTHHHRAKLDYHDETAKFIL